MKITLYRAGRVLVTLVATFAAAAVGWSLWIHITRDPWTRDGHVRADVVNVGPDVSGLITAVMVHDNQRVKAGDVLFRVDPQRFQIALARAKAAVFSQKTAFDQAVRDRDRLTGLGSFASDQQREQAAATAAEDQAAYQTALANLNLAKLNLARSTVTAPVDGTVTNFDLQRGDYATAGRPEVALVDSASIRVEAYFEETKLLHIRPGEPATIRLMGGGKTLHGRVVSIAAGIEDQNRSSGGNMLANINPTFTWVRLAQRVPVRIALDPGTATDIPLIVGLTATVSISPLGRAG